jgi:hypothetical protein
MTTDKEIVLTIIERLTGKLTFAYIDPEDAMQQLEKCAEELGVSGKEVSRLIFDTILKHLIGNKNNPRLELIAFDLCVAASTRKILTRKDAELIFWSITSTLPEIGTSEELRQHIAIVKEFEYWRHRFCFVEDWEVS